MKNLKPIEQRDEEAEILLMGNSGAMVGVASSVLPLESQLWQGHHHMLDANSIHVIS